MISQLNITDHFNLWSTDPENMSENHIFVYSTAIKALFETITSCDSQP